MKKIFFVFSLLVLFLIFSVTVGAEENEKRYIVNFSEGEYTLTEDLEEIVRSESILPIISVINLKDIYFDNVRIFESIEISNISANFSGSIFCDTGAKITFANDSHLRLHDIEVRLLSSDAALILNGGELILDDAFIDAVGECAVYSYGEESRLKILNDTMVCGAAYDIASESFVSFFDESGEMYTGGSIFKLWHRGDGKNISEIAKIAKGKTPPLKIYSRDKNELSIFTVSYVNDRGKNFLDFKLSGEKSALPEGERVLGYDFVGWTLEGDLLNEPFAVSFPMTLYAKYKLSAPVVSVDGLKFTYDGQERVLKPGKVIHPYADEGEVLYRWYLNGKLISEKPELNFKNVNESGEYKLEVIFEYKNETSVSLYDKIEVKIEPRKLYLEYEDDEFKIVSGDVIFGDNVEIKEVEGNGAVEVKTDNSNYCLEFSPEILKKRNTEIRILGWTLVLLAVLCAVGYLVFWSAETDAKIASIKPIKADYYSDPFVKERVSDGELHEVFFGVDALKADELLSDRMAKNMITKGARVLTVGSIIKVDVSLGRINESFSDDDTVDINKLKEHGIIPEDAGAVKVSAEGILDKPLKIMANEFDITAVKMIILSGGEAIKVKSRRKNKFI